MSEQSLPIERYMSAFQAALQRYGVAEWQDIGADLRSHIAEALQFGKALDEVLRALGPADVLARAYAVELKMNRPANTTMNVINRVLGVLGILAASGIVSFIVVTGLGSIAVGLFGSGVGILTIGLIEAMGIHLPGVQLAGLPPLLVAAIGPVFMLVGAAAGWLLWLYVRALIGMLRRTLPRAWSKAA